MTHLADELREGLLALAVGTGLQVMDAIFEESVTAHVRYTSSMGVPEGQRLDMARGVALILG